MLLRESIKASFLSAGAGEFPKKIIAAGGVPVRVVAQQKRRLFTC